MLVENKISEEGIIKCVEVSEEIFELSVKIKDQNVIQMIFEMLNIYGNTLKYYNEYFDSLSENSQEIGLNTIMDIYTELNNLKEEIKKDIH